LQPGNDSGCTAVVALLRGRELYVANAGDSRCVVCRDGKAVDMSFDHKPEDAPEMERIRKAGGKVTPDGRVNGGLNLSRALGKYTLGVDKSRISTTLLFSAGDHAYKTNKSLPLTEQMISPVPDVKQLTINPETDPFMILACDGIWNSMSSQEVVDFVRERLEKKPEKLSSVCEEVRKVMSAAAFPTVNNIPLFQLFDHCLSPDTLGDGTGCDNMTAVIIQFKDGLKSKEVTPSSSVKRPAEETAEPPSKKTCIE
jgi:protein phosphatase 1G